MTTDTPVTIDLVDCEVIDDLDQLIASLRCSCSSGDDNPH
jgi:hypothetical protein